MMLLKKVGLATIIPLALGVSGVSQAASVWKISSSQHTAYIGGTIHVLAKEDYPLPKEYDQAFKQADSIVFETDLTEVSSPAFGQKLMSQMMLPAGTTIESLLKPDTYEALKKHLSTRGIPLQNFASFKPSMLAITLSMVELQMLGLTSEGVDLYYSNLAKKHGKQSLWLESPDEQISFLMNMGQGDEDSMIEYTLRDLKKMPTMINQLRDAWRSGDMQAMADVGIKDFVADYPEIYQDLLVKRNNNWIPEIEKMLNDKPIEFILVGALHLAGPDSVLSKLRNKGYKVEKL